MHPTVLAIIISTTIMLILLSLGERFAYFKQCYFYGISLWSRWLPVIMTSVFALVLLGNMFSSVPYFSAGASVRHLLSAAEIAIFLLAVAPLLLTSSGAMVGIGGLAYLLVKIVIHQSVGAPQLGISYLLAALTTVIILNDKTPWLADRDALPLSQKIRDAAAIVLALGALMILIVSMFKAAIFSRWSAGVFGVTLSQQMLIALLVAMFIVWMTVALGLSRHFTLPMICLPTIYCAAFVTSWPAYMLVIPFIAAICLTLAMDRRITLRR